MFWTQWEERLSKWKLQNLAAELLEHGSALNLLFAQAIHIAQPLFHPEQSPELDALTDLLESQEHSAAFASHLRKEHSH